MLLTPGLPEEPPGPSMRDGSLEADGFLGGQKQSRLGERSPQSHEEGTRKHQHPLPLLCKHQHPLPLLCSTYCPTTSNSPWLAALITLKIIVEGKVGGGVAAVVPTQEAVDFVLLVAREDEILLMFR